MFVIYGAFAVALFLATGALVALCQKLKDE
jgi:hypothetical protein